MKSRNVAYVAATGLVVFAFTASGVMDLLQPPAIRETMSSLGYPFYVATLLGVWKLLGAAAIGAPRLARLKEWAYAGMVFDLSGAAFSHAAAGDAVGKIVTPLVLLALVATSWALRPASRTLPAPAEVKPARGFGQAAAAT
ncbi:MAG: DoxX family protein [Polyangiaceae bacterium]